MKTGLKRNGHTRPKPDNNAIPNHTAPVICTANESGPLNMLFAAY